MANEKNTPDKNHVAPLEAGPGTKHVQPSQKVKQENVDAVIADLEKLPNEMDRGNLTGPHLG